MNAMHKLTCGALLFFLPSLAAEESTSLVGVWIQGEALFWKAAIDQMNYVIEQKLPTDPYRANIQNATFDWNWGYRLSAGYTLPHDRWDIAATWTSIEHSGSHTSNTDRNHQLLQPIGYQNSIVNPVRRAEANWSVALEQIELCLGKEFHPSPWIRLRPMGGLRSAWIDQDSDADFFEINTSLHTAEEHSDWDFWGLGFVAGACVDWRLTQDWSLFSFADYSILWGFFAVDQHQANLPSQLYRFKKSMRCARGVYDLGIGIKWTRLLSDNRWRLGFKAAYEYHLYPEQNQFLYNTNTVSSSLTSGAFINNGGDLVYQGISLSLLFEF